MWNIYWLFTGSISSLLTTSWIYFGSLEPPHGAKTTLEFFRKNQFFLFSLQFCEIFMGYVRALYPAYPPLPGFILAHVPIACRLDYSLNIHPHLWNRFFATSERLGCISITKKWRPTTFFKIGVQPKNHKVAKKQVHKCRRSLRL